MEDKHKADPNWANRAWEYHHTSDGMLHTRVSAMLVCQSFMIAAYVTLTLYPSLRYGSMLGIAIIILAATITIMFLVANIRTVRGITFLKRQIVSEPNHLYKAYLDTVNPRWQKGAGASQTLAVQLPIALLIFWIVAAIHLALTLFPAKATP